MTANGTIEVVSLDPELNKASFISYLQQQSRFKDYDFSGSDMNILLDILSINTFKNAFYLNMAMSEGFLDSAQLINDVRSHAKDLNYTPRSISSAGANVTATFTATGESQPYVIPKGSTFSSHVKNQNFTFSTEEIITLSSANNTFTFTAAIFEGIYVKDSYYFDATTGAPTAYKLTNPTADTSSLVVNVYEDGATIGVNFNRTTSLLDLNGNSQVFFLQCAADDGNYEILFGDGVLGYQPKNGSLIVLDYRLASGEPANGAGIFNCNFDPTGAGELTSSVSVTTNQVALGGAGPEDIETTRFYAPRYFQTQERAIVPSDYITLLTQQFPEIQAINAYGGETLIPPQFARTVISVQIANVNGLPNSKIQQYTSFMKGRNAIPILPVFVPAKNVYVGLNVIVRYNVNVTTETNSRIQSIVATAVQQYNDQELDNFNVTFRLTSFTEFIANSDPSIVSTPTSVNLYQKIFPTQTPTGFSLAYSVPLANNFSPLATSHAINLSKTVTSSSFYYKGNLSQLEDDGLGTVRIVNVSGNALITAANTGIVDYVNGIVQLNSFGVDSYSGDALLVYVAPQDDDIIANQNTLLSIEPSQTNITVQQLML